MNDDQAFSQIPFWHLVYLIAMVLMGRLTYEEYRHMLAAADENVVLVYDADGNSHLLLPDYLAGRPRPLYTLLPYNEKKMLALDAALLKPSCCEAPDGLSHYWFRPNVLGASLAGHAPRADLAHHPDL